ncbi:hypothetical protein [Candidatus Viadribacter manganicus]|uniref:Yip1 domain-containing protein n=1 Tax=Candidatus Viadribacter manganicus TaxID=1759059 RepID=A0A1B1AD79_9PROT|nr:hypothetical protein [Candidatus Viadribacter manganicus]ANP44515.1 hypothetical protein ATE48_00545 [Candidatus Viadribacter manganicus]
MSNIDLLVDQLVSTAGDLWFAALLGQFFVMVCESAKPKPAEVEEQGGPRGFALLVTILSLITPLLLFFHAFLSGSGALVAVIVAIFGAVITATIVGWIIRAAIPDVARVLNRAAPILALLVFVLALYVSWETVFAFINGFITARAAG